MDGGTALRQEPSEAWPVGLREGIDCCHSPAQKPARTPCGLLGQGQAACLALEAPPT